MEINNLMIVDDEVLITEYLNKQLSRLGYTVFCALDGYTALKIATNNRLDLIFLDVKMPKLDGLAVCKKLRQEIKTKDIPIVMLSAKAQPKEIQEGLDAGADKYLTKPIGFPDIVNEIEWWKQNR